MFVIAFEIPNVSNELGMSEFPHYKIKTNTDLLYKLTK